MRMRKKKHLEERLSDVSDLIIFMERDDKNFQTSLEKKDYVDFSRCFENNNPLHLEIGCGKGGFICEIAQKHPEINFIAVEKASNVIVEAAEKVQDLGLKNVIFLRGGAEYLECYIKDKTIDRIYLNFSCPFPKKSQITHRLTHHTFLRIYKNLLKENAEIWQKTDNRNFFEFSIEEFSTYDFKLKNISLDLHNSDIEENIVTEYEARFVSLGCPIYRLEAYLK